MRSRRPWEAGQAAVELALVLPVVVLLLALLVQVGLVVRDQVLLVHATREVARQLAIRDKPPKPPPGALAALAARATGEGLDRKRLVVTFTEVNGRVRVRAGYRAPIRLPLLSSAVRDVPIAAYAEANREID